MGLGLRRYVYILIYVQVLLPIPLLDYRCILFLGTYMVEVPSKGFYVS